MYKFAIAFMTLFWPAAAATRRMCRATAGTTGRQMRRFIVKLPGGLSIRNMWRRKEMLSMRQGLTFSRGSRCAIF